jgi:hypothetical protein
MDHLNDQTKELIIRDFGLPESAERMSEEELFRLLADHIDYMIEHQMEMLLSLMYRMDVDEGKVHFAMSPFAPDPANEGLAKLVLERQQQRAATKQHYKQGDIEGIDKDLDW